MCPAANVDKSTPHRWRNISANEYCHRGHSCSQTILGNLMWMGTVAKPCHSGKQSIRIRHPTTVLPEAVIVVAPMATASNPGCAPRSDIARRLDGRVERMHTTRCRRVSQFRCFTHLQNSTSTRHCLPASTATKLGIPVCTEFVCCATAARARANCRDRFAQPGCLLVRIGRQPR